jgi:hypothetical protein
MAQIDNLTSKDYPGFVQRHRFALVNCWAIWDTSHLYLQARIGEAVQLSDIVIATAMWDTDDQELQPALMGLLEEVGILCVPTLLYFKDGRVAFGQAGIRTVEQIRSAITQLAFG